MKCTQIPIVICRLFVRNFAHFAHAYTQKAQAKMKTIKYQLITVAADGQPLRAMHMVPQIIPGRLNKSRLTRIFHANFVNVGVLKRDLSVIISSPKIIRNFRKPFRVSVVPDQLTTKNAGMLNIQRVVNQTKQ